MLSYGASALVKSVSEDILQDLLKVYPVNEAYSMDDLASAWRRVDAPSCPKSDDEYWVHTLQTVFTELEALGLSEAVPKPEPKKRGRKPKAKEGPTLKRPRGRPRKNDNHSAGLL